MKAISLLWAVVIPAASVILATPVLADEPPQLRGRQVFVRLYNNWDFVNGTAINYTLPPESPDPFEMVMVRMTHNLPAFCPGSIDGAKPGKSVLVVRSTAQSPASLCLY